MKCKYCGCTDSRACIMPTYETKKHPMGEMPCHWVAPFVCSNPSCMEKHIRMLYAKKRHHIELTRKDAFRIAEDLKKHPKIKGYLLPFSVISDSFPARRARK